MEQYFTWNITRTKELKKIVQIKSLGSQMAYFYIQQKTIKNLLMNHWAEGIAF